MKRVKKNRFIIIAVSCLLCLMIFPQTISKASPPLNNNLQTAPTPEPTPPPPFAEIGDAYLASGNRGKAIEFYIESLKVETENREVLTKLKAVLQDVPKYQLTLADYYLEQRNYDKALELYLKVLESSPNHPTALIEAKDAIDSSNSLDPFKIPPAKLQELVIQASTIFIWALIILVIFLTLWIIKTLWTFAGWVYKHLRQRPAREVYAILPFNTMVTPSNRGLEVLVRSAIMEWLFLQGANPADDFKVKDLDLPDIGNVAKVINWLIDRVRPKPKISVVDGTLIVSNSTKIGLTVRKQSEKGGVATGMRTFWFSKNGGQTASTIDVDDCIKLAYQAAAFVFDPELELSYDHAHKLYEANQATNREDYEKALELLHEITENNDNYKEKFKHQINEIEGWQVVR